jgi:hypothetical protein
MRHSLQPGSCYLPRCGGDILGQMLSCAPHWSFLSEELRRALVVNERQQRDERKVGNLRRATREEWKALVALADGEWAARRAELVERSEAAGLPALGPHGQDWYRRRRQLEGPEVVG